MPRPASLALAVALAACAPASQQQPGAPTPPPSDPTASAPPPASAAPAPVESDEERAKRLAAELEKMGLGTLGATASPSSAPLQGGSAFDAGAAKVQAPKGDVLVGSPVGAPADAVAVIARSRARFRACYQRALNENPEVAGSVSLTLSVASDGKVQSVTASPSVGLPSNLFVCLQRAAETMAFSPPPGGAAKIVVPLTLARE